MMKYDRSKLYCFSPPVMIVTFIIEIALALYALWKYRLTPVTRIAVALFVSLSIFQLAEFMVCQQFGNSILWSRVGFMSIALLPPLGLHLLAVITKSKWRWLVAGSYIAAGMFIAFFLTVGHAIEGNSCLGNYVIFQLVPGSGGLFAGYYYGLLIVALVLGWQQLHQKHTAATRRAINGLMFGYTIFIIPTILANVVNPETISGIPSIMCGFAVLLALVVSIIVLPAQAEKK